MIMATLANSKVSCFSGENVTNIGKFIIQNLQLQLKILYMTLYLLYFLRHYLCHAHLLKPYLLHFFLYFAGLFVPHVETAKC